MSFALMRAVEQSALPRRERAVARAMAYYVRDETPGPIAPGVRRLMQRTGYSQRSVHRALIALEALGILTRRHRMPNRPTVYWFHAEQVPVRWTASQLPLFRKVELPNWQVRVPDFPQADPQNRSGNTPFPQDAQVSTGQNGGLPRQIGRRSLNRS